MTYFVLWSFFVGGALITACGVAGTSLFPLGDPNTSKIIWGIFHSLAGLGLVWIGGFRVFESVMQVAIGITFVSVLLTASFLASDWTAMLRGLITPQLPLQELPWLLGVLGGVGGTVTLLSYGYWVREKKRSGEAGVRICRLDLATAYILTALFGVAMIIIGSRIQLEGQGIRLAEQLADQLALTLGPLARWTFILGFWGAVFSSLLGVWQSAPYLFADFLALRRVAESNAPVSTISLDLKTTPAYRGYLVAIAVIPVILLWFTVERVQLAYAVMGALFMPLLAITLLVLNNRQEWVGSKFRNYWWINALLIVTILLFGYMGTLQLLGEMPSLGG